MERASAAGPHGGRTHELSTVNRRIGRGRGPGFEWPDSDYALQLTGGTLVYGPARNAGTIDVAKVRIELPTAGSAAPGPAAACRSTRHFRIRLSRKFKRAKVWVAGTRVKVTRRKGRLTAPIDLRGKRGVVPVRVAGKTKQGKTRKRVHRYRAC